MWFINENNFIIFLNLEKLATEQEIILEKIPIKKFLTFVHTEDRENFLSSLEVTRKYKRKTEFQYRLRLNNNKENEFQLVLYVADDKQTNVLLIGLNFYISTSSRRNPVPHFTLNRWKIALEHSNIGLWDANLLLNKSYFSKQWKDILGYKEYEISNQADEWDRRVHPEDYSRVIRIINEHLIGQTPEYSAEYRMRCKDGSYKWVLAHGRVLRNENNEPVRLIGTHADITDRKTMENKLLIIQENLVKKVNEKTDEVLKEKYRIETMLDAISDSILVLSKNGLLYYANRS